ncbi:MAG: hypothetical protein GWN84_00100 [Gammaproteobacteria bacterium]|nr:hypothetical protein [Gammaproteobacteria bacterium]NIR81601.1 hypothetical protein [Gammaproteobacteria bacterium]NIU02718.1 hypothetical protein [Gammaproteobacteria bacterium]NIX83993.1 hypothetical protein [Gammaproteobacteria bacterium]
MKDAHVVGLAVAPLMAVVLYLLSVGPAARAAEAHILPPESMKTFYAPVEWLYRETPLRAPIRWYVEWWLD